METANPNTRKYVFFQPDKKCNHKLKTAEIKPHRKNHANIIVN